MQELIASKKSVGNHFFNHFRRCMHIKSREEAQYCIHCATISKLHSSKNLTLHSLPVDQDDELDQVVVLSFNPLCIAVIPGRYTYALIIFNYVTALYAYSTEGAEQSAGLITQHKKDSTLYKCTSCTSRQCIHIKVQQPCKFSITLSISFQKSIALQALMQLLKQFKPKDVAHKGSESAIKGLRVYHIPYTTYIKLTFTYQLNL